MECRSLSKRRDGRAIYEARRRLRARTPAQNNHPGPGGSGIGVGLVWRRKSIAEAEPIAACSAIGHMTILAAAIRVPVEIAVAGKSMPQP